MKASPVRPWKLRLENTGFSERIPLLQKETGLSSLAVQVCLMRGLSTSEAIQKFLNPKFESLSSPSTIRDMDRAVSRLAEARARGEKVRVFADYDVDGTTGAALLTWVFRDFGMTFDVRQPDRFKDGYGLNVRAVEEAAGEGVRVLLTVDCGISSFDAAERARELGIDLIVVDHHQLDPERGLPSAVAVVNPQRDDCPSGLRQLCGCGVAYYLVIALRVRGREEGWFSPGTPEPNLRQHLDLVVMATAADMVPLVGDNHILARHGLEVLKNSKKPGVRALLEAAGLGSREISPGHLGFVLGPRINASGRMQSASIALDLLTTVDASRATRLAQDLERLNAERAEIQNQIWDEVRVKVEKGIAEGSFQHGVVVADPGWHEGVVGIVATRVTETFHRPAAVIALKEDIGKGSIRSYGGKDVLAALRESSSVLLGFGGHKHAAGLSIAPEQVEAFTRLFDEALARAPQDLEIHPLLVEGECNVREFDVGTVAELEKLGPFGPGNPEPVFVFRATVRGQQVIKGRHVKFSLGSSNDFSKDSNAIEAIWFHAAERNTTPVTGEDGEWAGVPELNRFRGKVTPTIRVRDWRKILMPASRE
ncbi:MAG TPA: single-stranded-DNA-specific exonuclease RecJ [Bdellovibrionota bacterium]|nr:single-stranded-DNA-specific exonuclease RecJ [Bdellovibrionota bacterium]